jgi:S1-C subfamily serine protease
MKRQALYSSRRVVSPPGPVHPDRTNANGVGGGPWPGARSSVAQVARHPAALWAGVAVLALLMLLSLLRGGAGGPSLTQAAIDAAVLRTLETQALPSPFARAYDAVLPSVVRVTGFVISSKTGEEEEHGVGTGVVIVDRGVILTNLHVVLGAQRLRVEFHDGTETTASMVGAQPENDLAVLQAHEVPDDLTPAVLASTADLVPGDQVLAVGFPFGIGPSASAGVISGLERSFRSPAGEQLMTNLIQFDAAANPGNSGGPLVTMDGEVVGIVTAIYNPNEQRTFVGIGFAVPIGSAASAAGLPPF